MNFKVYIQHDQMDCGPSCLRMIAKHYGRQISIHKLREILNHNREGVSLNSIAEAAEKIGLRTMGARVSLDKLLHDVPLPCIVYWKQQHFVILHKVGKRHLWVADPSYGNIRYTKEEFLNHWVPSPKSIANSNGIVLILQPSPSFYHTTDDEEKESSKLDFVFDYLKPFRSSMIQLIIGLIAVSLIQLAFPFITQSIVDIGVYGKDLKFIYLLLLAQLFLFIGRLSVEGIRAWILLHISSRINISMISDFFVKLMNLPISFFDQRMTGDIMQRINDHRRIESLMTNGSLSILFSGFNIVVFGLVLTFYDVRIFGLFFVGTLLYLSWIILFMKKRKELDYKRFQKLGDDQSKVIELINGMQEIKLHNAERQKRWSWEYGQAALYRVSIQSLKLEQVQSLGANFINEIKNILLTFLSAYLVIKGQISLGMMLAISYILGQLNSPISQMVSFFYSFQDAKIALERLQEIHSKKSEEQNSTNLILTKVQQKNIQLENICFKYPGSAKYSLEKLSFIIPFGKTTAIVGSSGSGKTTLMKLLLQFYEPSAGSIKVGTYNLSSLQKKYWRSICGVVMQDGYIFNDSIENNIGIGDVFIDQNRLHRAIGLANLNKLIESLPLGLKTKIGNEGMGLSGGEKQRIYIARAIYKNPQIIFFDEATSSLDAKNEREIHNNLLAFLEGKTALVIAHRLSTIKNADQIIVMKNGEVSEMGTHYNLIEKRGEYYKLISNQLELAEAS